MSEPTDAAGLDVAEERFAVFDARNQYYRLWMWILAQAKVAAVSGDWVAWRRSLMSLYNHAQSFFSPEERADILKALEDGREAYVQMQANDRSAPEYRTAYDYHLAKFENAMNTAERGIYDAMKKRNMLLPQTSSADGEFKIDELLSQSDM